MLFINFLNLILTNANSPSNYHYMYIVMGGRSARGDAIEAVIFQFQN